MYTYNYNVTFVYSINLIRHVIVERSVNKAIKSVRLENFSYGLRPLLCIFKSTHKFDVFRNIKRPKTQQNVWCFSVGVLVRNFPHGICALKNDASSLVDHQMRFIKTQRYCSFYKVNWDWSRSNIDKRKQKRKNLTQIR